MPRSSSAIPIALTKRNPPELWRMALAIFFATSSRSVARLMLKAMSGIRAPMTMAPAAGCGRGGPKSGAHSGARHLRRQPFELATSDVLEVAAGRRRGRLFVEEDRNLESGGDFGRGVLRKRDALGHRDAVDRHERHDIHGAEPRMLASVRAEIDVLDCRPDKGENGGLQRFCVAGQREHRAMVCGVR